VCGDCDHDRAGPRVRAATYAGQPARDRSSICGISAIIAANGAIDADDEHASYAMAAILALGRRAPVRVSGDRTRVRHDRSRVRSVWVGLAVDKTAEATGAGSLYSDAAGKFAVLSKTTRNATIGFVVLGYALYWAALCTGRLCVLGGFVLGAPAAFVAEDRLSLTVRVPTSQRR
jgi:hypothetical protein